MYWIYRLVVYTLSWNVYMQDTHALEWCWISYFHSSIPLLLLQIQQVTFFLLHPSRKIVSGVLSFLSLSHLLVSYISTRHMKIHLKLMTSRIYIARKIYPTLIYRALALWREFRKVCFTWLVRERMTKKSLENGKQIFFFFCSFQAISNDLFFILFSVFSLFSFNIYISCETREVEIFLFCFSCRVNGDSET